MDGKTAQMTLSRFFKFLNLYLRQFSEGREDVPSSPKSFKLLYLRTILQLSQNKVINMSKFKYQWCSTGDIGAAATIVFDNLTVLLFVSLILQFGFHFPLDIILNNIVPGTVMGVLLGNLLFIGLAFIIARRENRNVTAMPHGLDAPSAIGFASCIVGPVFVWLQGSHVDTHTAAVQAWHIGACSVFFVGLIKLVSSLIICRLSKFFPSPALLGAIGGLALAIIGFLPLISIFKVPAVGVAVLAIILAGIYARYRLPFNIPIIPGAIIIGTLLYYVLAPTGLVGEIPHLTMSTDFVLMLRPHLEIFDELHATTAYFPVFIPFVFLVIFGTMSVVKSADSLGREQYNIKQVAAIDGIATLCSALFGGIAQTTPYAGFVAYKKLDARAGFLVINILVVGLGGLLGLFALFVDIIPESAVAPVLLFVAFEISMQGFIQSDKKYTVAILFAFLPSLSRLLEIKIPDGNLLTSDIFQNYYVTQLPHMTDQLLITVLGNGFFITAVLWGSWLCYLIDHKRWQGACCALALSIFSFFGIIHSVFLSGEVYLPWLLPDALRGEVFSLSLGYLLCGFMTLLLRRKL